MASQSLLEGCSSYEVMTKEEEPFAFQTQLPPLFDFSGYQTLDYQSEYPIQEGFVDAVPLMDVFPTADPLYPSLDIVQSSSQEDLLCNCENGCGVWNELGSLFSNEQAVIVCNNEDTGTELREERKAKRSSREDQKINTGISKLLTRHTISQYFYMPITQAAKELNVGLTLLKKRCRELGIRRWPHRKLMSLQTLIKNIQELGKVEGEESEPKLREAIDILERERKLLEEMPDMQLEKKTKRLRQACFKANYKKRKLMGMVDRQSPCSSRHACFDATIAYEMGTDDEEIKSLMYDSSLSSANIDDAMN